MPGYRNLGVFVQPKEGGCLDEEVAPLKTSNIGAVTASPVLVVPRRDRRLAPIAALALILAIAAVVGLVLRPTTSTRDEVPQPPPLTAAYAVAPTRTLSELLTSTEVAQAATEQLCPEGHTCDPNHFGTQMGAFLGNISDRHPAFMRQLELIKVDEPQRRLIVEASRHVRDRRLYALGLHTAKVINRHEGESRESIRHAIMESLEPRQEEWRQLREEVFPGASVIGLSDEEASDPVQWKSQLGPDVTRFAARYHGWDASIEVETNSAVEGRQLTGNNGNTLKQQFGYLMVSDFLVGFMTLILTVVHNTGAFIMDTWAKVLITIESSLFTLAECAGTALFGIVAAGHTVSGVPTSTATEMLPRTALACGWDLLMLAAESLLLYVPKKQLHLR